MKPVFDILINERAGTVLAEGLPKVIARLHESFGDATGTIRAVPGADLKSSAQSWLGENIDTNHRLVVGGGDGTLRSVTPIVMDTPVVLGVLPLGTMNVINTRLGFDDNYAVAARQLRDATPARIDVGMANDRPFLIAATIDAHTTKLCLERETARTNGREQPPLHVIGNTLLQAFARAPSTFHLNRQILSTRFLLVALNRLAPLPTRSIPTHERKKIFRGMMAADACGGKLAAYNFNGNAVDAMMTLMRLRAGLLNTSAALQITEHTAFTIRPALPHARRTSITLDGDEETMAWPLKIAVKPGALQLLRKAPA